MLESVSADTAPDGISFNIAIHYGDNVTITSSSASTISLSTCTNSTLVNNTISGSIISGFFDEGSNGTYLSGNTAYNCNYSGFELYSNDATLVSNTAYGNGIYGIASFELNDYYHMVYGINSTGATINSNTVYGNGLGGIFLSNAQNATIRSNTVYSNGDGEEHSEPYYGNPDAPSKYFGIGFADAFNMTLEANTIHDNMYYGFAVNDSDEVNSTNDLCYGNLVADVIAIATYASDVSFDGLLLDTSNYPNISFIDALEASTTYTIKRVPSPNTNYPEGTAVQNRLINITNITGSPTIDSLTWAWGNSEQNDYNESTFELWKYVTSWVDLNATKNTAANTLNHSLITTEGAYGMLGEYYWEDPGGGGDPEPEPDCYSDSDCGACEECSGGECILPSGACASDSDCDAGETCESCECAPPECTSDSDCGQGYVCEDYECIFEETGPECVSDSDCVNCEECSDGECVLPTGSCISDSDCAGEGETCESCICIPPECADDSDCIGDGHSCINYECTPPECTVDSDCGAGGACESYSCIRPECTEDDDCAEDEECKDYECVEKEAPIDGGAGGAGEIEVPPEEGGEVEGKESQGQGQGIPIVSAVIDTLSDIMLKNAPSQAAGASGEVDANKKELSEAGWFFVLGILAIILYFGLTKLLPKLPGGTTGRARVEREDEE